MADVSHFYSLLDPHLGHMHFVLVGKGGHIIKTHIVNIELVDLETGLAKFEPEPIIKSCCNLVMAAHFTQFID